jgi:CheY-like chemotaxis protein
LSVPRTDTDKRDSILVVDEDVISRHVISEYLRHCGYVVAEAASADEALTILKSREVALDVVLSAMHATGGTEGFSLAHWIRENRPDLIVLLVGTIKRAADAAADLCEDSPLSKPYEPQTVVDRIRRLRAARAAASDKLRK